MSAELTEKDLEVALKLLAEHEIINLLSRCPPEEIPRLARLHHINSEDLQGFCDRHTGRQSIQKKVLKKKKPHQLIKTR